MDRPHDRRALEYYAHHWVRLASEFRRASFGMLVRHEDLVSDTGRVAELQNYLEMAYLDVSFIAKSQVKGGVRNDSALNWLERYRAKKIIWNETHHYEYKISKRD